MCSHQPIIKQVLIFLNTGREAWHGTDSGSLYLNTVFSNLEKSASTKDLETIMKDVSQKHEF